MVAKDDEVTFDKKAFKQLKNQEIDGFTIKIEMNFDSFSSQFTLPRVVDVNCVYNWSRK